MDALFREYEHVIFSSVITTFGWLMQVRWQKRMRIDYWRLIMSSNLEEITEVLRRNGDIEFEYKGKVYFLTYYESAPGKGDYVRALRAGLDGEVIKYFEDKTPEKMIIVDGKTMFELADEVRLISLYGA